MNQQSAISNPKINRRQIALDTIRSIVTIVEVIKLSEYTIQQIKLSAEKYFSTMEKKFSGVQDQVIKNYFNIIHFS